MVEVAAAEEVWVFVLIFLVHALLKVYDRESEAVRKKERCESFGGRLVELLERGDVVAMKKILLVSPAGGLVRYSLDVFLFCVGG